MRSSGFLFLLTLATSLHAATTTPTRPTTPPVSSHPIIGVAPPSVVTMPNVSGVVGGTVTLQASVKNPSAGDVNAGTVVFTIDGQPFAQVQTSWGAAKSDLVLDKYAPGAHKLTAEYKGDGVNAAAPGKATASLLVVKAETFLEGLIATTDKGQGGGGSPAVIPHTKVIDIYGRVDRKPDGNGVANQPVSLQLDGKTIQSKKTDASGGFDFKFDTGSEEKAKNYSFRVQTDGDARYLATGRDILVKMQAAPPPIKGKAWISVSQPTGSPTVGMTAHERLVVRNKLNDGDPIPNVNVDVTIGRMVYQNNDGLWQGFKVYHVRSAADGSVDLAFVPQYGGKELLRAEVTSPEWQDGMRIQNGDWAGVWFNVAKGQTKTTAQAPSSVKLASQFSATIHVVDGAGHPVQGLYVQPAGGGQFRTDASGNAVVNIALDSYLGPKTFQVNCLATDDYNASSVKFTTTIEPSK